MNFQRSNVKLIKYNSQEFYQACQLRYKLFFAPHSLPKDIVLDPNQADYFHAAMTIKNTVVAYGQLVPHPNQIYQICQMVVVPAYQRQNLGTAILLFLIQIAKEEGATSITLNARLTAVSFYQRLDFQTHGKQFPSSTTGIPHITMNRFI
ncbi:MAG: GNAT family N-acetyltransferase [Cyanobacteria bacterium J06621_12]